MIKNQYSDVIKNGAQSVKALQRDVELNRPFKRILKNVLEKAPKGYLVKTVTEMVNLGLYEMYPGTVDKGYKIVWLLCKTYKKSPYSYEFLPCAGGMSEYRDLWTGERKKWGGAK